MTPEQRRTWIILRDGYDRNKVLKTNADVIRAIKISQRLGKVIDPLGPYIIRVADKVGDKHQFKSYTFREDMLAHAVLFMTKSCLIFDPSKSSNPHAYLATCCWSAFTNYLSKEKKANTVKEEMLERVKHGQAN